MTQLYEWFHVFSKGGNGHKLIKLSLLLLTLVALIARGCRRLSLRATTRRDVIWDGAGHSCTLTGSLFHTSQCPHSLLLLAWKLLFSWMSRQIIQKGIELTSGKRCCRMKSQQWSPWLCVVVMNVSVRVLMWTRLNVFPSARWMASGRMFWKPCPLTNVQLWAKLSAIQVNTTWCEPKYRTPLLLSITPGHGRHAHNHCRLKMV